MRGSHHPDFMHSLLTIIHMCSVPLPVIARLALASLTFFKDKIMLHCSPEVKCQEGFTTEIGYQVFNLLGYIVVNAQ